MANTTIPPEERDLTPEQVEALDARRRRGHLFIVLFFLFAIFSTLLTVWAGQDLTYGPGWNRPMAYYCALTGILAIGFGLYGLRLRRGIREFGSW